MELFSRPASVSYDDIKAQSPEEFRKEWNQWRRLRLDYMKEPYGWLSLTSIDWLEDGESKTLDGFPGQWLQEGDAVTYIPPRDTAVTVTNRDVILNEPLRVNVPATGDFNLEDFYSGGVRAQLIKRIGLQHQFAVRIRDPHSPGIARLQNIPTFEPDQRWVFPPPSNPPSNMRI